MSTITNITESAIDEQSNDPQEAKSKKNNYILKFFLFIFEYSIPIAAIGAMFFTATQLLSFDPSSILVNKNFSFVINIIIGISGFITLMLWSFAQLLKSLIKAYVTPYIPSQ